MGKPHPLGVLTEEAFWSIVEPFQLRLARFVQSTVGDAEDARDVVQDVFVSAWRTAQRRAAPFAAEIDERAIQRWLFRVAYNKAIDVVRHHSVITWESLGHYRPLEPTAFAGAPPFDDQLAETEALRVALARLGPQDVVCLRLSVIEEFTSVEIAQILAITPEAARQRLSRATYRLRSAYFAPPSPSALSSQSPQIAKPTDKAPKRGSAEK